MVVFYGLCRSDFLIVYSQLNSTFTCFLKTKRNGLGRLLSKQSAWHTNMKTLQPQDPNKKLGTAHMPEIPTYGKETGKPLWFTGQPA